MFLLLEEGESGGLRARQAGLWDRLSVRFRSARLDRGLAGGASPDANVELALRARTLMRMSVRRDLARSVRRIMDGPARPTVASRWSVPVCRDKVTAAREDLGSLVDRLLDPGPVSVRGLAHVSVLLGDGSGPLYNRGNTDDLRATVRATVEALDFIAPL
jgi:hypothetical protein